MAFVSNGGYIDGNTADGVRKCLTDEFDAVYCYNLRGNQRTAGELSRKEGGKIFGSGSRNTVAVIVLVKGGRTDAPRGLFYRDIGNYLSREDKLGIINGQSLDSVEWQQITPNADGDWINQRDERFATFAPISETAARDSRGVFALHSAGLQTNRDPWVYNFSEQRLLDNVESMVDFFNEQVTGFHEHCTASGIAQPQVADVDHFIDRDAKRISWSSSLISKLTQGKRVKFAPERITMPVHRPFNRQMAYFDRGLNHRPGKMPQLFPTPDHENFGFYITGTGSEEPFSVLMTDAIPDLHAVGTKSVGPHFAR